MLDLDPGKNHSTRPTAAQFVTADSLTFASNTARSEGKSILFWASSVGSLYVSFHQGDRCLEVETMEPAAVRELIAFLAERLPVLEERASAYAAKRAAEKAVA